MKRVCVISIFPEMFEACRLGMSGRALEGGELELSVVNPRDFTSDNYRRVDDRPYGGGPGMVMMAEPLFQAIETARARLPGARVVYLSPQGRKLDQKGVKNFADGQDLILLCGRYEGIDERLIEAAVDEELSIGDYVLAGGELPAMVLIEAMVRWLPGVLGNEESASQDSFIGQKLDCRHYTRPEVWRGRAVPEVLLSGNHRAIEAWREQDALARTKERRADLLDEDEQGG